jgi:hypothetical protein
MNTALKAIILDRMGKVTHDSITGDAIRMFVIEAHLKTDKEVKQTVDEIQSQMKCNPRLMRTILGKPQYSFFKQLRVKA